MMHSGLLNRYLSEVTSPSDPSLWSPVSSQAGECCSPSTLSHAST